MNEGSAPVVGERKEKWWLKKRKKKKKKKRSKEREAEQSRTKQATTTHQGLSLALIHPLTVRSFCVCLPYSAFPGR